MNEAIRTRLLNMMQRHGIGYLDYAGPDGNLTIEADRPDAHAPVLADRPGIFLIRHPAETSATAPAWRREYDFRQFWGVPALDLPALAALDARIEGGGAQARAEWAATYPVGHPAMWRGPLPPQAFRAYACAIGHADPGGYQRCVCGAESR